jgi:predicted transcriptional regulator of viral defense system
MQAVSQIKKYVESVPPGKIITYQDFNAIQKVKPQALAKALERLVKQRVLVRQAKGAFYRPKQTVFGPISPSDEEILSFLTHKGDRITGMITGQSLYLKLQISTQVPSVVTIATITPRRSRTLGKLRVRFVRSYVASIEADDVPLLQLLEALRFIKKAQGCTPDEVLIVLEKTIRKLFPKDLQKLTDFARAYPPMVRAICG